VGLGIEPATRPLADEHLLVYVDDRVVDKKLQNYNPHGSVSPLDSRSGSVFRLDITHVDTKGKSSRSVPNGCIVL
jgi:hypothetical protein